MHWLRPLIVAGLILSAPAQAQLLPTPGGGLGSVAPDMLDRAAGALDQLSPSRLAPARLLPSQLANRLVAARSARIADLLRRHGDIIERDDRGEPARRGVILLTGGDDAALARLRESGYAIDAVRIEGIDLAVARLTVPPGKSLRRALPEVRSLAPDAQASADTLYAPSGETRNAPPPPLAGSRPPLAGTGSPLAGGGDRATGLIDGGVARHPALTGAVEQRGFAHGAPRVSSHGTAVASLISGTGISGTGTSGAGIVRGAAPGTPLLVADVYGDDPAGGGAFAIARALGWMAARRIGIVTISLVGPDNPLLAGAIRLAQDRGVTVVAAVGNDGPAAPPAYPASYPNVIAVTGIDGRGRLLPEAGRARHVDFAAPGADMDAAGTDGGKMRVRGTSYAAPLVAGRLFARGSLAALRTEAKVPARDRTGAFGHGIICDMCRNID